METISYAFHAVMPLLLTIAMGYFLTRMGRWDRSFFSRLSSLCYRILLPIQLFYNVYQIEALSDVNWRVVLYTLIWVPIGILVGIGAAKLFIPDRRQKGVLVQAVFRSNQAILGMPLTQSLGGEAAVAVTSVVTSLGIPLYNISAVIVLETYCQRDGKKTNLRSIGKAIATNPLIIGVFTGLFCVLIRRFIPQAGGVPVFTLQYQLPSLYKVISTLSAVASPMMLICLGAQLDFRLTGKLLPQIGLGVFLRLIFMPVLGIGFALLLKDFLVLTPLEIPMMLSFFASPVAVSSVLLVQELGGDEQYASQLVIWSSAVSMLTLFILVAGLRAIGML